MSKTLQNAKDDIKAKLHGASESKMQNFYSNCQEAAGRVLLRVKPMEMIRIQPVTGGVFTNIYDYSAPDDLDRTNIIDVRKMVNRTRADDNSQTISDQFDREKRLNTLSVQYNKGVKSLRLVKEASKSIAKLHSCDSTTAQGTITAGGDASIVGIDTYNYLEGSGALKFDLSGSSGSGYIEFDLSTASDLSIMEDIGSIFNWFYTSAPTRFTSIALRFGSSSGNYWSTSVTGPHDASAFKTYWNLLRFGWENASETGTPDDENIDYLRITFTYSAGVAITGNLLDNFVANLGAPYEIQYYSRYFFRTSSGTWIEIPTTVTDLINLDFDTYNLWLYEMMDILAQQIQGEDASFDRSYFRKELDGDGTEKKPGLYRAYEDKYPSQTLQMQTDYHEFDNIGPDTGYNEFNYDND